MLFSWKMDQINYFVLKYWRRRGRNISKFWVTSLFQHRCSARTGKQEFQWRKRIANFTSKKCKWQQFNQKTKSDRVYGVAGSRRQGKMTSTDLRRTINAPTWTDFHLFLQKKLTTDVYKTKRSSTEWFISSINWQTKKCLQVCARASEKGGRMRWRARPTAIHSHEWTDWFSSGMETTQRISTNQYKQHRAIFVWMKIMKNNKDFIKVRRKAFV